MKHTMALRNVSYTTHSSQVPESDFISQQKLGDDAVMQRRAEIFVRFARYLKEGRKKKSETETVEY